MRVRLTPAPLAGRVTPPTSKSQTHRFLIAAALAGGSSALHGVADSQDIRATCRCLTELGACIHREGDSLRVEGVGANARRAMVRTALPWLDCGESGSTLRFLIPLALALRCGGLFTGQGRLMDRPLDPYLEIFARKGIGCELREGTLTVCGSLPPGEYSMRGDVSSQFVTGLLYALPLLEGDSRIVLTSPLESRGYVDMTLQALGAFGVEVENAHYACLYIPGEQHYRPGERTVEADWSQAGFWYAARALGCPVEVDGLDPASVQGDRVAAEYFDRLSRSGEVELDVSGCPDLAPPLAAAAAARRGTTRLVNAARLRIKESDRIAAIAQVLNAMGASVEEGPDYLVITGREVLAGGTSVSSHNDHRIAMMAAVAAIRCAAPVTVLDAQAVEKSYPAFWDDYARLGGGVERMGE